MKRRDFLKNCGLTTTALAVSAPILLTKDGFPKFEWPVQDSSLAINVLDVSEGIKYFLDTEAKLEYDNIPKCLQTTVMHNGQWKNVEVLGVKVKTLREGCSKIASIFSEINSKNKALYALHKGAAVQLNHNDYAVVAYLAFENAINFKYGDIDIK